MNKYNILIYPTTDIIIGKKTPEQHIEASADALYDEWVCGCRFSPDDLKKLIDIAVERRNNKYSLC